VIAQTHSRSLRNVNRRAAVQIPVQSVARRDRLDTHRRVMGGEERKYPRQGSNKRGIAREKPEKDKPPGAKSGTTKRRRRRGQVKKAKTAKKANGRKGGAR
jgi:hypothetical protein